MVPQPVDAPLPAHDLLLEPEDRPRQVGRDPRPRIAPVLAPPHELPGVVQPRVRERADRDRRIPVEPQRRVARLRPRADVDRLVALLVVSQQVPDLPLEVDRVRVRRIDGRGVPVGAVGDRPVGVRDAVGVGRPRRPELAAVVLRPAVDVVEGEGVVEGQLVELRHRQVLEEAPGLAPVARLVDAAVAAVEDVAGVALDEGHGVVVAVLVRLVDAAPGLAAVVRRPQARVHLVDAVEDRRVGEDLLIVVRPRPAADVVAALLPALAPVGRPVEALLLRPGLDRGVDDARVDGRDRQADLADVALGQAHGELAPGLAAVLALVDARLGPAAHERRDAPAPLVGRGVEDVRVRGVELDRRDARVLGDLEDERPGLAAVRGLVEAALAARRPERPLGRDEDDVRIARVDQDPADVLGLREPHVRPGLAAVRAPVDAVAEADVAPADVLARAHPDGLRVRRVERDAADRVRRLGVEHRRPGRAGVLRLPDAARADRDVPGVPLQGVDDDVADPSRHDGWADVAEGEPREELGVEARLRADAGAALSAPGFRGAVWAATGAGAASGDRQGQAENDSDKRLFHGRPPHGRKPIMAVRPGEFKGKSGTSILISD